MKKIQLIRTIATAAVFAVAGMSAFAQITAPAGWAVIAPTGNDVTDTVTVGSIMPYRVTGDINMHALRAQGAVKVSHFTKVISANGTIALPDGSAGTPALTDTLFTVKWNTAGTSESVKVTEVSQSLTGTDLCTGTTETLPIVVVNRPTVAWNVAANPKIGCSLDNNVAFNIPISVTGTGQWDVDYKIDYTPITGLPTSAVNTVTIGGWQNFSAAQTLNLSYTIPVGATGTYTFTITKITDRISRKSGITSVATDLPATTYKIFALPTPTTGKIQHIKNL
jgi:hypothetical protein